MTDFEHIDIPDVLPLLPVRDMVMYPSVLLPLFVGRDMSINAVEKSLSQDRLIVVAAQKDLTDEDPLPERIYTVGVVSQIMRMLRLPDGRVKVMAEGEEADLERFAEALKMENSFFWVSCVEIKRFNPHGDFNDFYLALTERDYEFWLDEWIKYLEELLDVTKEGFERVVRGTDRNPPL